MVIILQQTSDNGCQFISTVVEENLSAESADEINDCSSTDDLNLNNNNNNNNLQRNNQNNNFSTGESTRSNCSSSFSLNSQHSISERSAIYKQRIDTLFGRRTKLNKFNPQQLQPFCIKIGEQVSNNNNNTHLLNSDAGKFENNLKIVSPNNYNNNKVIRRPEKHVRICAASTSASSDDDELHDYQTIQDNKTLSSIVTDSLNNFSRGQSSISNNRIQIECVENLNNHGRRRNIHNVTSVQINCENDDGEQNVDRFELFQRRRNNLMTSSVSDNMGNTSNEGLSDTSGGIHQACSSSSKDNYNVLWRNNRADCNFQMPCTSSACDSIEKEKSSNNNNNNNNHVHENRQDVNNTNIAPSIFHGCDLRFPVEYLGSTPVEGNTTALEDLQAPLCSLYANFLNRKNILHGELAITKDGLRFEASKLRLVNPFSTIAVWAAIKFVAKGEPYPTECAFMPLISDPEGQDKGRLFGKMNDELFHLYKAKCLHPTNSPGLNNKSVRNPPIFACVMREASFSLDCHAFVCRCAEDAIVVAANLYQSLVDKMKNGYRNIKEGESGYGTLTRNSPANTSAQSPICSSSSSSGCLSSPNRPPLSSPADAVVGDGCCSSTNCLATNTDGSSDKASNSKPHSHRVAFSDSDSILAPIRPPRLKHNNIKKKHGAERNCKSNLKQQNTDNSVMLKIPQRRISINKGNNGNGNYRPHYVKNVKRVTISTPEEELSSSSSSSDLIRSESIDQVLDRIINPSGMSFNDLKPSYQQLLLKIALTLTQDQLYQKSKEAMKKHQFPARGKGKNHRRKKPSSPKRCETETFENGIQNEEQSQFLGAFLKSFSKITSSKMMSAAVPSPANSARLRPCSSNAIGKQNDGLSNDTAGKAQHNKLTKSILSKQPSKLPRKIMLKKQIQNNGICCTQQKNNNSRCNKEDEQFMSFCSGCACDNCSDKCYCSLPSKNGVKMIGLPGSSSESVSKSNLSMSSNKLPEEEPLRGKQNKSNLCSINEKSMIKDTSKPSTSISASSTITAIKSKACGYDTDSCAGSEKCYCSLQRVKSNGLKIYNINLDTETSDTDTNSYDLETFNPLEATTTMSSSSNLKTVSTKSVEILSYNPARRSSYCSSNGNHSPDTISLSQSQPLGQANSVKNATFQTNVTVHHSQAEMNGSSDYPSASTTSFVKSSPYLCSNANNSSKNIVKNINNASPSLNKSAMQYFHSSHTSKGILCNNGSSKQVGNCNKILLMTGLNSSPTVMYKDQYPSKCSKRWNDHNLPLNRNKSRTTESYKNLVDINEDDYNDETGGRDEKDLPGLQNVNNSEDGFESNKVLSMKKTAEIAAMFNDLHVNQRMIADSNSKLNDAANNYEENNEILANDSHDSVDFEESLGYLP